ncbi:hypothetical protein P8625_04415 [Tenacibaculum tangerinum]|uniref:Lipoprotein n=1 Tax=Tenacibaculum tangerinum TaxID=3038772 RepID=A0ABY8L5Q2_9FLAO|nr:hypothetical protein [Tenacibaculum tangerinum]WGH76411.1 hypothetical protein P8625_04415 [Tenacibaculum tangerinum]
MKKLLIVTFGFLLMISCTDKKKQEDEKKIEAAIQKIDSIESQVKEGMEKLNEATKKLEEQLQKIDSI